MRRSAVCLVCFCVPAIAMLFQAALADAADDEKKPEQIVLAEGKIKLDVPSSWKKEKPRTRIVDFEFSIPAVEDDKIDGRVTVMGAGGSIDANIGRWVTQFVQPDRTATSERTIREEKKIAGQTVHLVDITGDFKDQPRGPFGPTVMREKYRMLGAIIVTDKLGQYFVKAYGPRRTIAENEEAFKKLVDSLKVSAK
jgi:hypothetical protein